LAGGARMASAARASEVRTEVEKKCGRMIRVPSLRDSLNFRKTASAGWGKHS